MSYTTGFTLPVWLIDVGFRVAPKPDPQWRLTVPREVIVVGGLDLPKIRFTASR